MSHVAKSDVKTAAISVYRAGETKVNRLEKEAKTEKPKAVAA